VRYYPVVARQAVKWAYCSWYCYNRARRSAGANPVVLDSLRPQISLKDYALKETRNNALQRRDKEELDRLLALAQEVVNPKWLIYEEMAARDVSEFLPESRALSLEED
jgi:pyruvate-ferredoxin/flavodoxin oxidoreductase